MCGGGEGSCGVTRTCWHTHTHTHLLVALATTWPVISRQCLGVSFLLCAVLDVKQLCYKMMYKLGQNCFSMQFASCSALPQVPWGRPVTFVGVCLCNLPRPAPGALVVLGSFLPSSPRCSRADLSSGKGCRSWNFICAWCWSRRCSVKWSFPRVMFPWVSDFSSLWALCKLMDAKGVLSAVGIGQGEEQRGWFQGCTHLLPSCHAHNRAAGAFWHFGFFSVQLLNPRFCFVHYCSFTFHWKLFTPCAKNRKFRENTE